MVTNDLQEIFSKVVVETVITVVAEEIYIGTITIVGSVNHLAETLSNARDLSRAAKENVGVIGNSVIVGMGVYTGGSSALQYSITTDTKAKTLYALSAAFSTSAIVSGGLAVASRTCHISGTAAVSEAFGFALMQLGNKAHVMALQLEGKPVPPQLKRFINPNIRPLAFNTDGLGFIMPRMIPSTVIGCIPFEKIGQIAGFGLAVYGYTKVLIVSYRYGQQFISKFKKFKTKRKSNLIKKQASFLIVKIIYKTPRHILFCTEAVPVQNKIF